MLRIFGAGTPMRRTGPACRVIVSYSIFLSMMISSVLYSSSNPCFRNSAAAGLSTAMSSYRAGTPFFFAASHSRSRPLPP